MAEKPHVVIIGGGFGGLKVAQRLKHANVRITLVDRRNFHLFQPLLYQVATAALAPGDIAEPIRHILSSQRNVEVVLGEATAIDLQAKTVTVGADQVLKWDKIVVAAGARYSYFGHDEWAKQAPGLKTVADALEMRRKMLLSFEEAEWCDDPVARRRLMTFAIIGGGPTGVEMAGAIAEIASITLLKDFRHIDTRQARVVLVEALPEILNGYPDDLRKKAHKMLDDLGVEVRVSTRVTSVDKQGITIDGGERIDAANLVWAAGVQGEPIGKTLGVPLDRGGRVKVEKDLSVPGCRDCFVIGDLASFEQEPGKPLPGVAQVALQMAATAASNIGADLAGRPRAEFRYRDLGKLATIGRSRAVADLPWFGVSGLLAWLIWVFIHLMTLVAFRNRLVVFWKWAFSYLTYDRGSRLIWQDEQKLLSQREVVP